MSKTITCNTTNATYHLTHLTDEVYSRLWEQSVGMHYSSGWLLFQIQRAVERRGEEVLQVGQVYVALKQLCQHESSRIRDTWKSSFLFPFLLTGTWNQQGLLYLFRINNYRGSLEMSLRRLMAFDHTDMERYVLRKPLEDELPQQAIDELCEWMYGFLVGYFSTIPLDWIEPFYQRVDSNLILFGFKDGAFFQWQYQDPDVYEATVQQIQPQIAEQQVHFRNRVK